jgi:hypothetical protein
VPAAPRLALTADIDRIRADLRPAAVGWWLPILFLATLSLSGWLGGVLPWWASVPLLGLGVGLVALARQTRWALDCTGEELVLERSVVGWRVERTAWKMEEIQAFSTDGHSLTIGFASRPPWVARLAPYPAADVERLVGLLEEVRRSSVAFWRDELAAGRRRERAGLDRLRERGE